MGKSIGGQAPLRQGLQPPVPLRGDLLERRAPHRGVRVADQGHRRRRGGIARRALGLTDFEKIAQAAILEHGALFGCRVGERRVQVRRDGFEVGRCRDRGLHLRERLLHRRVVGVDGGAAGGGVAVMVSAAAAGPRPTGAGIDASSATPTADRYRGGGTAEREAAPGRSGVSGRRTAAGSR